MPEQHNPTPLEQKPSSEPVATQPMPSSDSKSTMPAGTSPESGTAAKSGKSGKKLIRNLVIVTVVALLLLAVAGSYWLVYQYSGENAVKSGLKNALPFPVAMVNGTWVPLEDYEKNVTATQYFFSQQESLQLGLVEKPDDAAIRENEFDRQVDLVLLQELADERGVTVSAEDIDAYVNDVLLPQAPGGLEEIEQTLSDLYGWTLEDFKEQIVAEVVLREKLRESFANDEAFIAEARTEAEALRAEIDGSETPFSDFAQQHSDDTVSAADGGNLGSFGRGVMVPEFEEAAFALAIGEMSQPVKTQYGYHILRVTARDDAAGTVEASHILIAWKSVDELLAERREQAKIKNMMPNYGA